MRGTASALMAAGEPVPDDDFPQPRRPVLPASISCGKPSVPRQGAAPVTAAGAQASPREMPSLLKLLAPPRPSFAFRAPADVDAPAPWWVYWAFMLDAVVVTIVAIWSLAAHAEGFLVLTGIFRERPPNRMNAA